MRASELPFNDLCAGLREWAVGIFTSEAAVELLIAHRGWLLRADVVNYALWVPQDLPRTGAPATDDPFKGIVGIDRNALATAGARASASDSEMKVLAVVLSLLGIPDQPSLRELLSGLDEETAGAVLQSLAHAAGWHQRPNAHPITGLFDVTA